MSRTGSRAFTLIEVMVTTAVLALGVVLIYETYFSMLDLYNYYSDYLRVASRLDEKLWEAQDSVRRLGEHAEVEPQGEFALGNREFRWNLDYGLADAPTELYKVHARLAWRSGSRETSIVRTAYVAYARHE